MTVLVVTHDLGLAWNVADRVAVMYLGRIVEDAPAEQLLTDPRHPYTRALLSVVPERQHMEPQILRGETPDPTRIPAGCRFHPRCPARGVRRGGAARHRGALPRRGPAVPSGAATRVRVSFEAMSTRLTYTSGDLGAETDAAFEEALEAARGSGRRSAPASDRRRGARGGRSLRAARPGAHRPRGEPRARGRAGAGGGARSRRARAAAPGWAGTRLRGALPAAARGRRRDRRRATWSSPRSRASRPASRAPRRSSRCRRPST